MSGAIKINSPVEGRSHAQSKHSRVVNGRVYRFVHKHSTRDGETTSCVLEAYRQWSVPEGDTGWIRVHRFTYQTGGAS